MLTAIILGFCVSPSNNTKDIAKEYGVDQLLVNSSWSNYTNTFDSLSADQKADWDKVVNKGKIVIGYTLFAPIAYK